MTKEKNEPIQKRVMEIAERNGGRITPDLVIEDARSPESPLHTEFEWDIHKAASYYWIERAREIIRSVDFIYEKGEEKIHVAEFVRDPRAPNKEQGYVSVTKLRNNKEMAREALLAEFDQAAAYMRRAHSLAEALGLTAEVQAIIQRIGVLRERAKRKRMRRGRAVTRRQKRARRIAA